jgi:NTE family protein
MANRELVQDYRQLIEDMIGQMELEAVARVRERPLYIQLMGDVAPVAITRFVREGVEGESASRDYDFSRRSIERNKAEGYAVACKRLQTAAQSAR